MSLDPNAGSHREAVRSAFEKDVADALSECASGVFLAQDHKALAAHVARRLAERGWV